MGEREGLRIDVRAAKRATERMRVEDDFLFPAIRDALALLDEVPDRTALGGMYPDDVDETVAVLATPQHLLELELRTSSRQTLQGAEVTATLDSWRRMPHRGQGHDELHAVDAVLAYAGLVVLKDEGLTVDPVLALEIYVRSLTSNAVRTEPNDAPWSKTPELLEEYFDLDSVTVFMFETSPTLEIAFLDASSRPHVGKAPLLSDSGGHPLGFGELRTLTDAEAEDRFGDYFVAARRVAARRRTGEGP
jgi:hypothetical protein